MHVATVVRASENIARGRPTLWIPRGPFKNRNIKQTSPPNHLFFSFHYFVLFCFFVLFFFWKFYSLLDYSTFCQTPPAAALLCVFFFCQVIQRLFAFSFLNSSVVYLDIFGVTLYYYSSWPFFCFLVEKTQSQLFTRGSDYITYLVYSLSLYLSLGSFSFFPLCVDLRQKGTGDRVYCDKTKKQTRAAAIWEEQVQL